MPNTLNISGCKVWNPVVVERHFSTYLSRAFEPLLVIRFCSSSLLSSWSWTSRIVCFISDCFVCSHSDDSVSQPFFDKLPVQLQCNYSLPFFVNSTFPEKLVKYRVWLYITNHITSRTNDFTLSLCSPFCWATLQQEPHWKGDAR